MYIISEQKRYTALIRIVQLLLVKEKEELKLKKKIYHHLRR